MKYYMNTCVAEEKLIRKMLKLKQILIVYCKKLLMKSIIILEEMEYRIY